MYSNGDRYVGHWLSGKKDGRGIMYHTEKIGIEETEFKGIWKNDMIENGQGLIHIKISKVDTGNFIGNFKDGLRHGEGVMHYTDEEG